VSDTATFIEEILDINTVELQALEQGVVIYEKENLKGFCMSKGNQVNQRSSYI